MLHSNIHEILRVLIKINCNP